MHLKFFRNGRIRGEGAGILGTAEYSRILRIN